VPYPAAAPRAVLLFAATTFLLAACGFVGTGSRPSTKPDVFPLHGYVSVGGAEPTASAPADSSAPAGAAAQACRAPAWASDIHAGGAVRVADTDGRTLGSGQLTGGVVAGARCNFAFVIPGVRGGVDRYVIGVGSRAVISFPARDLRENKAAVIPVEP
jgi:hypothetical protein